MNQTFNKNGNEIELEVIDTELGVEFRINRDEIDVDINRQNYYMKYKDERFEDIPANIRPSLAESGVSFAKK
ncbi:hypothetical protein P4654_27005 [Niallia taxi]|uniref:hypothetical protein n=1 Tax=Niallia taxi TaxID=2499688 RepID=UPI002E25198C|nr:hypothetical protein [Niallia taxi]MED4122280.1 hypothetical protein [Niallia taxi]